MKRTICGGSWYYDAGSCRSASRGWRGPSDRDGYLGFRLVEVVEGFPGSCQVIRGNSWINSADNFRLVYRDNRPRSIHDYDLGFRLVEGL